MTEQDTFDQLKYRTVRRADGIFYYYRTVRRADGIFYYNSKNQLHRDDDQPAAICSSGMKCWYKNGDLHRDNNKPAVTYNGTEEFWINGEQIR